ERLGGGQIDDQIEFARLLDGDVARFCPAKNLVDIVAGAAELVGQIWSVGHEASRLHVFPSEVDRRQSRGSRQDADANPVDEYQRLGTDNKRVGTASERLKGRYDILGPTDLRGDDLEPERVRGCLSVDHLCDGATGVCIGQDRQPTKTWDELAQKFEPFAGRFV